MVREDSRRCLLDAALELLCRDAVNGIEKLLTPEALQEATRAQVGAQGVSRHTAYRLWPNRSDMVIDVAQHVADPAVNGDLDAFEKMTTAYAVVMRDQEQRRQEQDAAEEESKKAAAREGFHQVLGMAFAMELGEAGMAASWVLHSAALTSSPVWQGPRPGATAEMTGRAILAARSAYVADVNERWSSLFRGAMAAFGRRPRPHMTVERIVQLMLNQYDGSLHNMLVDSQLNRSDISEQWRHELLHRAIHEAVDAIFELGWMYTEQGYLSDPRRPSDSNQNNVAIFERIVSAASNLYELNPGRPVDPKEAAARADESEEAASVLFPDSGDLADSVLRGLVASSGIEFSGSQTVDPRPLISSVLTRVHRAATNHPAAVTTAKSRTPTHPAGSKPFLDELTDAIAGALRSPKIRCEDPEQTANLLMTMALGVGDDMVRSMLEIIPAADVP